MKTVLIAIVLALACLSCGQAAPPTATPAPGAKPSFPPTVQTKPTQHDMGKYICFTWYDSVSCVKE